MSRHLRITSEHDVTADDRFARHVVSPPATRASFCCACVCVCVCVRWAFLFRCKVTEGLIKEAGNSSILKKVPVLP